MEGCSILICSIHSLSFLENKQIRHKAFYNLQIKGMHLPANVHKTAINSGSLLQVWQCNQG